MPLWDSARDPEESPDIKHSWMRVYARRHALRDMGHRTGDSEVTALLRSLDFQYCARSARYKARRQRARRRVLRAVRRFLRRHPEEC